MCTVTFIARQRGYALGMNRDEKLTRAKGLPPKRRTLNGVKVLCPSESDGGSWIALNETGATLALINWYSVTRRVALDPVSRGEVVKTLGGFDSPNLVAAGFNILPLRRINPFRLVGIFPTVEGIVEWCWDLKRLVIKNHPWMTQQWISSGFDEPEAQRVRGETFQRALGENSVARINWLRRLHCSHNPEVGPFSTCMHRADAATVSYTEVTVSPSVAMMSYHAGALCENLKLIRRRLLLRPPDFMISQSV